MASIITVLASAGVAIGLALQGALSNLAGGIMIIFFKPFKKGDYVDTAGASGTVDEVTLFYTTFLTPDNKRILVPNGQLMNANVVNYSSEETRRVDLNFICSNTEQPSRIENLIMERLLSCEKVLKDPEPFARLNENSRDAMIFSVKVWLQKRGLLGRLLWRDPQHLRSVHLKRSKHSDSQNTVRNVSPQI